MAGETDLVSMLPAGHSIGSIRSRHPTLYVFTGGNEDSALFIVNGFSLLLDGGDQQQIPYWNLIRNYDKISAVMASRMTTHSLMGLSTIFARKLQQECHPSVGAFIANLAPRNALAADNDVARMMRTIYDGLHAEGVKPTEALATPKLEPITLYEVIGEGAVRMIVLNPERGSKELSALANAIKSGENIEKYAALTSLAALFVWHPADTNKPTIRILYPGACPLDKLYAALEKLKGEEYLRHLEYSFADRDKYASTMSINNRASHGPLTSPSKPLGHKVPSATTRQAPTTTTTTTGTAAAAARPKKPTKPPTTTSAPTSARPPNSTRTSLSTATHTTTTTTHTTKTTTKPISETAAKKTTRQPLGGAAPSRMSSAGGPPKKSSPTKPTANGSVVGAGKTSTTNGKPAPIRKAGAKSKDDQTKEKKEKPTDKESKVAPASPTPVTPVVEPTKPEPDTHIVSPQQDIVEPQPQPDHEPEPEPEPVHEPEPKPMEQPEPEPQHEPDEPHQPESLPEKSDSPPPVPAAVAAEAPAGTGAELPTGAGAEHPTGAGVELPAGAENEAGAEGADIDEKPPTPVPSSKNLLDVNGLLDGIEEPMKLRRISMDTTDTDDPAKLPCVADVAQSEEEALNAATTQSSFQQDTPLLDSTPDMPTAPPLPSHDHDRASSVPKELPSSQIVGHTANHIDELRSPIEELLGSGGCPFTAGLVSAIVDDATAESAFRKISAPPTVDLTKMMGLVDTTAKPSAPGADEDVKMANGNMQSPTDYPSKMTERSMPIGMSLPDSLTSPASPDSGNAQSDTALDDVIESLAGESEREDNPKDLISPMEEVHAKRNGGGDRMSAAAAARCQLKAAVQQAMEDDDAQEFYMPPVTGGARMMRGAASTRPSSGGSGAVAKPKLSQPLYFDVVFVPHRGSHPALVDEAAAKAFALSVRSKRYVMSGKDAIKPYILDGFIAAKTVWNKPELEIDVVPTHDSDDLSSYNQMKAGEMSEAGINLRCSVERCTLRLSNGDVEDFCAAFKFEM